MRYAIAGVILLVVIAGLAWGVSAKLEAADQRGYERGSKARDAEYAQRDNKALTQALARQRAAEEQLVVIAMKAAESENKARGAYTEGVKDGKATTERLIAFNTRLHDPGTPATSTACSDSATPSPGPAVAGSNAAAGTELSAAASEFLLRLTGEADEVVKQLRLAQAKIRADNEQCNAPLPVP